MTILNEKIKRWRFFIQLYAGKLHLLGYAFLIEICIGIGDMTFFLAFPQLFIYAFIASALIVLWKKGSPYITQFLLSKRWFLTPALSILSFCLVLQLLY